ncbi:MAG: hypothetical protein JWO18_2955 [Microbacteriaceae bacterium]|jgi:hypothetical protein|nr:hypothetical protein [Microbacteriaceae bacterium]
MAGDKRIDPTRVRDQPSLRTSAGRIWLIMGGLFAVVALAILIPMLWLRASGVATAGIVAVVTLYVVMIVVRFSVGNRRHRLGLLAACMITMAVVALVCVGVVTAVEWRVT